MAGEVQAQSGAQETQAPAAAKTSTAKAEVAAKELSDVELRAAFDKATSTKPEADEDEEPATSKRAYRESRRAQKTTTPEESQDAEEEDVDEDDDEEAKKAEPLDDDEDADEGDDEADEDEDDGTAYERALKVLALDGFTADDLKTLSKQRVLALAEKAAKRQTDVSKKLQAKAEQQKAKSDEAGSHPDAEDGDEAATSKGLRVIPKRLAAVFDDEAAEAIDSYVEERAGKVDEAFTAFQSQLTELAMENFRLRLGRKMPEHADDLDDDRTWGRVVKRMAALRQVNEHHSADELAREALAAVFKDRKDPKQSQRGEQTTPRAPSNRQRPPTPMAKSEIEREIFNVSTDRKLSPDQRAQRLRKLSELRSK